MAVKDNLETAGERVGNGSAASSRARCTADHPVVARLRAAGAVVVGLTAVPELCVFGTTDGPDGITRNPWDLARSPGGSSGGSAAAVAAGMVPVAHGNDGMGSVRIPAACCGLVGVKPGLGTVPARIGANDWYAMAENGVLATTVADAAVMLAVLAGGPAPGIDGRSSPDRRLRVALSLARRAWCRLDPAWERPRTRRRPHSPRRPRGPRAGPALRPRPGLDPSAHWTAGTAADAEGRPDCSAGPGCTPAWAASRCDRVPATPRAAPVAGPAGGSLRASTCSYAGPGAGPLRAVPWSERAWLRNVVANSRYAPFAAPWNLAGWPALVVPAGVGPDGLPLAVQLVGRRGTSGCSSPSPGCGAAPALATALPRLRPSLSPRPGQDTVPPARGRRACSHGRSAAGGGKRWSAAS